MPPVPTLCDSKYIKKTQRTRLIVDWNLFNIFCIIGPLATSQDYLAENPGCVLHQADAYYRSTRFFWVFIGPHNLFRIMKATRTLVCEPLFSEPLFCYTFYALTISVCKKGVRVIFCRRHAGSLKGPTQSHSATPCPYGTLPCQKGFYYVDASQ